MEKLKRAILNLLILALYVTGLLFIGIGLHLIWTPLFWIFAGVIFVYVGYSIYNATSEDET